MIFCIKNALKDIFLFFKLKLNNILNLFKNNKEINFNKNNFLYFFSYIAIAYSGGIDSSLLLNISYFLFKKYNVKLYIFHINHQLNFNSNLNFFFCKKKNFKLNLKIYFKKLKLKKKISENILRKKRYLNLGKLCIKYNINLILTAHHENDQIETILFKFFRGTGINGIKGIKKINFNTLNLFKNKKIILLRPLILIKKNNIKKYIFIKKISYIFDISNNNFLYKRNILRKKIIPNILYFFPNFKKKILNFSLYINFYKKILFNLAKKDFNLCYKKKYLNILKIKKIFFINRIINLIYYWIKMKGFFLISKIWLFKLCKQIINYKSNYNIFIKYNKYYYIISYKNKIFFLYLNILNIKKNNINFFIFKEIKINFFNIFYINLKKNIFFKLIKKKIFLYFYINKNYYKLNYNIFNKYIFLKNFFSINFYYKYFKIKYFFYKKIIKFI